MDRIESEHSRSVLIRAVQPVENPKFVPTNDRT